MKKLSKMYDRSVKQWNPFVGCQFGCVYCKKSFQRQIKRWGKNNCDDCYNFEPHIHQDRLDQSLPKTKGNEFIFVCSSGDISFCPDEFLNRIKEVIVKKTDSTFLLQSKNPVRLKRILPLPDNVILGTTIETDCWQLAKAVSNAPPPILRFKGLFSLGHKRKMVSIEPIMKFNHERLLYWIMRINPEFVYIGFDTSRSSFPQPTIEKAMRLIENLRKNGIDVIVKKLIGNLFNG